MNLVKKHMNLSWFVIPIFSIEKEIIVIDDFSIDGTREKIKEYEKDDYDEEIEENDEEDVLDKVEQAVLTVRQDIDSGDNDFISAKAVIPQIIDYLDELSDNDGLAGLPTGFIDLDNKLLYPMRNFNIYLLFNDIF